MEQIKVLLDSDVVISGLISSRGAAFQLMNENKIHKIISNNIKTEVDEVIKRQRIKVSRKNLLQNVEVVNLKEIKTRIIEVYFPYVFDIEDSHVVAAAHKTGVDFLLTYNVRHYDIKRIKSDFNVLTMKPGNFFQYLRDHS